MSANAETAGQIRNDDVVAWPCGLGKAQSLINC